MKYIRVINDLEDEYLITYEEHCEMVAELQDSGFDFEGCIVKQADTIEELCDQFVYVTNNGNHYVKNNHNAIHYFIGEERPVSYYGAIWTDKGLIYVAKMNEKGELELLWIKELSKDI